jgi:hypothetical protein
MITGKNLGRQAVAVPWVPRSDFKEFHVKDISEFPLSCETKAKKEEKFLPCPFARLL